MLLPFPSTQSSLIRDAMIGKVASRRISVLKDIADAAIYLGSDLGKYMNGSILTVDGGTESSDASIDCLTIPSR
jgi:enoyl-[acyl-carrier-protein] reductase (NADH)